jgi:hypothetical protein
LVKGLPHERVRGHCQSAEPGLNLSAWDLDSRLLPCKLAVNTKWSVPPVTFVGEFGRNWVYVLGPLIGSIKLPEFYAQEEARKSLRAAWVVAVNERERRRNRRQPATRAATKQLMSGGDNAQAAEPVRVWASWIERTIKDD